MIALVLKTVFLIVFICSHLNVNCEERKIQKENSDTIGMWFGPRVGKRALHASNERDRQDMYRILEAADALKYYYDQLQYYGPQYDDTEPKAQHTMFVPKIVRSTDEEKQMEVDFTPRLGRRHSSEDAVTPADRDMYRPEPEQVQTRTYFSPRLGRGGGSMTFSPRLGRNSGYDYYPESQVRVARSIKKVKS